MVNSEITRIQGINNVEMIYFKNKGLKSKRDENGKKIEYYIKPDVVIAENGVGTPKYNLKDMLAPGATSEFGEPPIQIGIDP